MRPRAMILRSAGTNCDGETAFAFERAGAEADAIHLNRLLESPRLLNEFQILAIPGGFSYGDDIAAGKILAQRLMRHLRDPLRDFVMAGKPIIGICNGFQVLVKTDLLPGPPDESGMPPCTLTNNDSGHFIARWIHLEPRGKRCIWTRDLPPIDLPIAHGEGKFVTRDESIRQKLWANDQIALVYARDAVADQQPANPNGSVDSIAGICDTSGLVFGLMPHPERYLFAHQNPKHRPQRLDETGAGLAIFRNAVSHAASTGAGL